MVRNTRHLLLKSKKRARERTHVRPAAAAEPAVTGAVLSPPHRPRFPPKASADALTIVLLRERPTAKPPPCCRTGRSQQSRRCRTFASLASRVSLQLLRLMPVFPDCRRRYESRTRYPRIKLRCSTIELIFAPAMTVRCRSQNTRVEHQSAPRALPAESSADVCYSVNRSRHLFQYGQTKTPKRMLRGKRCQFKWNRKSSIAEAVP